MFALLRFVLAVLASPFKSKSWLEAENVALRHQLIVLPGPAHEQRSLVLYPAVSMVSVESCRSSPSSVPRRSCVGIGPAFAATGVGRRAHWEGGRRSRRTSAC
jgi:hypothetical protein